MDNFCARLAACRGRTEATGYFTEEYVNNATEPQSETDPVPAVDVLGHLLQFFVGSHCFIGGCPRLHGNGCREETVDHDIGVATDGRGEVCVPI